MSEDLTTVINNLDTSVLLGSELYHHGIKGQKHGVRRYQNKDGSLTPEGRERYGIGKKVHSVTDAIRKKVKPSKNDLDDQLAKAQHKRDLREEKQQIRDTNKQFKRKRVKDMSNDEIKAEIERLSLEKRLKDMKESSKMSKGKEAFKNAIHDAASRTAANAIETIGNAAAKKIASAITANNQYKLSEREAGLQLNYLDDKEKRSDRRSKSGELLSDYYELMGKNPRNGGSRDDKNFSKTRRAREETEDQLKLKILNGDEEAAERYKKYREATQNNGKKHQNNDNSNNGKKHQDRSGKPNSPNDSNNLNESKGHKKKHDRSNQDARDKSMRDELARTKKAVDRANEIAQENAKKLAAQAKASKEQQQRIDGMIKGIAKHKYDKKIKNSDGTYRYIYDDEYRDYISGRMGL